MRRPVRTALLALLLGVGVCLMSVAPASAETSVDAGLITSVVPGALTITAGGTAIDLGVFTLRAADASLASDPTDIHPVTVTDTRAGDPGWNVSGVVADFVSGSARIEAADLGWTPRVITFGDGQIVTAAPTVAPAGGLSASGANAALGLGVPRLLASAAQGDGLGTAVVIASLLLLTPDTTPTGTYNAVLTLTAI